MKSAHDLRALADKALARARVGEPGMWTHVRELRAEARRRDLGSHAYEIGSKNVTLVSFREYLRAHRL